MRMLKAFAIGVVVLGNTPTAMSAMAQSNKGVSFPSREFFCASAYGSYASGSVPYCPARFRQCLDAESDAQKSLTEKWPSIRDKVRKNCVQAAVSQFSDLQKRFPAVKDTADKGGYYNGYSAVAVEQCVADKMGTARVARMPAMPAACVPTASPTLPAAEQQSAEAQCASSASIDPAAKTACIATEKKAKARLATLWQKLPQSVIDGCAKRVTQSGFDGSQPYRSSSFLLCADGALRDWGSGR